MSASPWALHCTTAGSLRLTVGTLRQAAVTLRHSPSPPVDSPGEVDISFWLKLALGRLTGQTEIDWFRSWLRTCLFRLYSLASWDAQAAGPTAPELQQHLDRRPPFPGAEYLQPSSLEIVWAALRQAWGADGAAIKEICGPDWTHIGRIILHLAENKRDQTRPFAFIATYADRVSASGQLQQVPLGRALQQRLDRDDPAAKEAMLAPLKAAASSSQWLRNAIESRTLFQALAWTPEDAHSFLQETPQMEAHGLVIKLPDWWTGRGAMRPRVAMTLSLNPGGDPSGTGDTAGGAKPLGVGGLLQFKTRVALGGETLTDDEWKRIKEARSSLINLRGRWIIADGDKLQAALDHWSRVQEAQRASGISFYDGMRYLAGLPPRGSSESALAACQDTEVEADPALHQLLQSLQQPSSDTLPPLAGFTATLRPYQVAGVAWLRRLDQLHLGGCLADDMGLGKTIQVIAWLCSRPVGPTLLIVPASLLGNWEAEWQKFAPGQKFFIAHASRCDPSALARFDRDPQDQLQRTPLIITTYTRLAKTASLSQVDWDTVILDEAQAIKTATTAVAIAARGLRARMRLALTGTPVENKAADLWSLFAFLHPGLLGSATEFAALVNRLTQTAGGSWGPVRQLTRPLILRRMKSDPHIAPDLPKKLSVTERCYLSKKQAVLYARLVEELKRVAFDLTLPAIERQGQILASLTQFRQVCNHPSHWSGDGVYAPLDSGKFQRLRSLCLNLADRGERALIFTQFAELCGPLHAFLTPLFGRAGLLLTGATPVGARAGLVAEFQQPDGPPFFVISLKAGGTGLTLTAAQHVIHFDRWWNPAVENQATDRAYRIGQTKNVLVHTFLTPGTIEERIAQMMDQKRALADDLFADVSPGQMLAQLSPQALMDWVALGDISRPASHESRPVDSAHPNE